MKVLHLLASADAGGIETLCREICLKSDFDSIICCMFKGGIIAKEIEKEKPNNIIYIKSKKRDFFGIIKEINSYIEENKIDIVNIHHSGLYCNIIYCAIRKKNKSIKFVRTLHSCYEKKYSLETSNIIKRILTKRYLEKSLEVSDLIISVSQAVQKSFRNNFDIENKRKVVIYNGIGEKFFLKTKQQKNDKNIVYVGRLERVKGLNILIDSIKIIKEKFPNVKLTIVGTGAEVERLNQKVKCLKLEENIYFVGKKSNVIEYLDKSDIFVYPSIWEEAFGISVLESMARGCIPITFYKGGLPEIIDDGINGFLVKETNCMELAEKIEYVIMLKDRKNIISKNAIVKAEKFKIQNTIKKLEEEYEKILNE